MHPHSNEESMPCEAFVGAGPRRDQVIGAGDCKAVWSSAGGWDPMTWTALERWTQSWLRGSKARDAYERLRVQIVSCLSTLGSTSAWRASSFPLARINPGVIADGPSDRCSRWRYRRIASYTCTVEATSPARLQERCREGMVFTIRASAIAIAREDTGSLIWPRRSGPWTRICPQLFLFS